jgi:hypothetical protein
VTTTASTPAAAATDSARPVFRWCDVREWGVEGKGWSDTEHYFDRLPARANGVVREVVWNLSRNSAGMLARFETDAGRIAARWSFRSPPRVMVHMPAVASAGLDLYAQTPEGQWRWLGIGRPEGAPAGALQVEAMLAEGLDPARRAYTVYLPLFANLESLEIGVPDGATFAGIPPRRERPICFYGTSIVHGAVASRSGMTHSAILGRRLDRPFLNLGFSGNGQMEPEVAALLAELDPSVFVVDCLPNMQGPMVEERAEPLVRTLRAARPQTPIVLVEDRTYTNAIFKPVQRQRQAASRAAFRHAYDRLLASGVGGLSYVTGEQLLGDDGEATVDSSHPTDLGFMRQAAVLEPVLRPLV